MADEDRNECPRRLRGTIYLKMRLAGLVYKSDTGETEANRPWDFFTVGDTGGVRRADDDRDEQVKAVVQPADGELPGPALAVELLASLDGRLATMKWPRTVDFIEEMPGDPARKSRKRRLRDPYWAGHDRPI